MEKNRIGECIYYSKLTDKEKFEFVEPNIRDLVNAINSFDGIETFASCEGHSYSPYGVPNQAYVAFISTNVKSLKTILNNITQFESDSIKICVEASFNYEVGRNEISYVIRVWGKDIIYLHKYLRELSIIVLNGEKLNLDKIL